MISIFIGVKMYKAINYGETLFEKIAYYSFNNPALDFYCRVEDEIVSFVGTVFWGLEDLVGISFAMRGKQRESSQRRQHRAYGKEGHNSKPWVYQGKSQRKNPSDRSGRRKEGSAGAVSDGPARI